MWEFNVALKGRYLVRVVVHLFFFSQEVKMPGDGMDWVGILPEKVSPI
jgi:hypothetical protein